MLEIPLDSKEIKPVNPKGNQPWITGRTGAEVPILWPPDVKSQLVGKDPDTGKDWGQERKRVTEDEMVGCHHWLNGHEFEQTWETVKDREAWSASVHWVTQSQTRLSDWTIPPPTHNVIISIASWPNPNHYSNCRHLCSRYSRLKEHIWEAQRIHTGNIFWKIKEGQDCDWS